MIPLKNKWLELAIVLVAPLLSVIDVFIINVAMPAIKKGVHATDGEVQHEVHVLVGNRSGVGELRAGRGGPVIADQSCSRADGRAVHESRRGHAEAIACAPDATRSGRRDRNRRASNRSSEWRVRTGER